MRHSSSAIQRHLAVHRTSGLSVSSYCRKHGLNSYTFRYWQKKFQPGTAFATVPFVKVDLPSVSFIEITTRTQATIRIPSTAGTASVLAVLIAVRRSGIA